MAVGLLIFWYRQDPHMSLGNLLSGKTGTIMVAEKASKGSAPNRAGDKAGEQVLKPDSTSTVTIDQTTVVQDGDQETTQDMGTKSGNACETECTKIEAFYTHLDEQDYIQAFKLPQPSQEYFTNLIIKLAQNPPVVTRETDDLFTILKNTAHFYRVIGQNNIQIIKGILDREKDSFEDILAGFYKISDNPECLKDRMGLDISDQVLYNYAGFFLNTIGGRLYLFRRDSLSRLAVSYYSIQLIDRANRNGTNSDGIDIRPAIAALIDELENTGNQLRLKEHYLDELYVLKEKYPLEPAQ